MCAKVPSAVSVVVPLLCAVLSFAQEGQKPATQDNLYAVALAASVTEMEKQWGYIDDGDHGSRIRTDYHHVRVRKNTEITDDLPTDLGDFHAEYLDDQALIGRYKSAGKEFSVFEIHPMRTTGSQLKIQISVSWVSNRNGGLILAISDWSNVEFGYDCEKQAFRVSKVVLGGI
jgi:hypothetical protein